MRNASTVGRLIILAHTLCFSGCADTSDERCTVGAAICRTNTVWVCGADQSFTVERACPETHTCVDGDCVPALLPDVGIDIVAPDTTTPPDTSPADTSLDSRETIVPTDTVSPVDTTPADTTDTVADIPTDTATTDSNPGPDLPDIFVDTTPDTLSDTTPDAVTPEAPPGTLGYERITNITVIDDLIRIAWHPSGDFAFVAGRAGDIAVIRDDQPLVKVGKIGTSLADLLTLETTEGDTTTVELLVLDQTLGLVRTRHNEAGDALETIATITLPTGSGRALSIAPPESTRADTIAIAAHGTNNIAYLYLWHPETGLSPVVGFNASGGISDLMWGEPSLYGNADHIITTHGLNGADSKTWIVAGDPPIVPNNWSPGFGNAGAAAWRPDPDASSGLGLYGLVSGWSSNKLYVFDGTWQMGTLPVPTGAGPQGIAWKGDGSRALVVGRVIGSPAYAVVVEHRPTTAAWSSTFVDQSIPAFTSPPWSGNNSGQYLLDVSWRPNTPCDEGLIVGADNGSSFSPTFGYVIRFRDLNDPACSSAD